MPPAAYRPQIDGLRAISVLAVIAFHLHFIGGGYAGVDVFFVISGFLLTGIIIREMESQSFSIRSFYVRRIRRILPALLVLIALSAGAGYFLLTPGDYDFFGRSALHAISATSNFFFFFNTGYFDPAANTMPLLHTWSLAIEEQFYLVWPALLVFATRFARSKGALLLILVAFTVASFAANVLASQSNALATFYLPQNRVWELAAGGCVALVPGPRNSRAREILPLVGLGMIVAALLLLPRNIVFPGFWGLLPVGGAMAVLWASGESTRVGAFLSIPSLRFVGQISYSLYLYHWPLIVFYDHYKAFERATTLDKVGILAATFILAWLSWRFIELPFRRARADWRIVFGTALVSMAAIGSVCAVIVHKGGLPHRLPEEAKALRSLEAMWAWDCPSNASIDANSEILCVMGRPWSEAVAHVGLWGDSNAAQFMPLMETAVGTKPASVVFLVGCSPVIHSGGATLSYEGPAYASVCDSHRNRAIETIKRHPDMKLVVIASAWGLVAEAVVRNSGDKPDTQVGLAIIQQTMRNILKEISAPGREIVILGEVPKWPSDPIACVITRHSNVFRGGRCGHDMSSLALDSFFNVHQRHVQEAMKGLCASGACVFVDIVSKMCTAGRCPTEIAGEFIFRDAGHIRRNLSPATREELASLLGLTGLIDSALPKSDLASITPRGSSDEGLARPKEK